MDACGWRKTEFVEFCYFGNFLWLRCTLGFGTFVGLVLLLVTDSGFVSLGIFELRWFCDLLRLRLGVLVRVSGFVGFCPFWNFSFSGYDFAIWALGIAFVSVC